MLQDGFAGVARIAPYGMLGLRKSVQPASPNWYYFWA